MLRIMKFGVATFPTDYSIPPTELARALEANGFESLFYAEHTHIPASRQSPWPGGPELPRMYWHTLDPFVALTAAATVTSDLKLATGVCLVIEHDPIVLAKAVASLDHISNGRFLFGVGGGWNREEMANHGTRYETRWKLLRERIEAMKAIWTQEEATYHGEFVNFDRIWSWPKPVQKPHPPILVGGDGPRTLHRVIRYGDGWCPIVSRNDRWAERLPELREMARNAGREISVTAFYARPEPKHLEHLIELGVERACFGLPDASADVIVPKVEELARLVRAYS